jgi:hypothetical protein
MMQQIDRHPDWAERLNWVLAAWHGATWAPESGRDCIAFARACIDAVAPGIKLPRTPAYRSEAQQWRALKKLGAGDMPELADRLLGPRQAPLMARTGDLISEGVVLGVKTPAGAFAFTEDGMVRLRREALQCCWPVGG